MLLSSSFKIDSLSFRHFLQTTKQLAICFLADVLLLYQRESIHLVVVWFLILRKEL